MLLQPRHCVPVCATGCPGCGGRRQAPGRAQSRDGKLLPPRRAARAPPERLPDWNVQPLLRRSSAIACAACSSCAGWCAISPSARRAREAFGFRGRVDRHAVVCEGKTAGLPDGKGSRIVGPGRCPCILPGGPSRLLHLITLLDLYEAARIIDPGDAAAAVDHTDQGAAASEGPVAAVIQLSGILLVNEAALAAGRLGGAEPRCRVRHRLEVGAVDQCRAAQIVGVGCPGWSLRWCRARSCPLWLC